MEKQTTTKRRALRTSHPMFSIRLLPAERRMLAKIRRRLGAESAGGTVRAMIQREGRRLRL